MDNKGTKTAKTIPEIDVPDNETDLTKAEVEMDNFAPIFVETEKMFDRLADLTGEIAHKAFGFFRQRGGEFGHQLEDWFRAESEILLPVPVEITETKDNINIRVAVPGFKPEEIEVSIKDEILILSGKTEIEKKEEDENTIFSEWSSNKFCRQLILPSKVEAEKVKAKLKNGVLQMTLPKIATDKEIQITVNAD